MREGDQVVAIDGRPALTMTPDDVIQLLDYGEVGRTVTFEVERGGKREKLAVRLREIL